MLSLSSLTSRMSRQGYSSTMSCSSPDALDIYIERRCTYIEVPRLCWQLIFEVLLNAGYKNDDERDGNPQAVEVLLNARFTDKAEDENSDLQAAVVLLNAGYEDEDESDGDSQAAGIPLNARYEEEMATSKLQWYLRYSSVQELRKRRERQ